MIGPAAFIGLYPENNPKEVLPSPNVAKSLNVDKIKGYIPIYSSVRGVHKIIKYSSEGSQSLGKGMRAAAITRSAVETIGLGPLLIVPDVAIYAYRKIKQQKS